MCVNQYFGIASIFQLNYMRLKLTDRISFSFWLLPVLNQDDQAHTSTKLLP
jgi:hypothetical protein